MIPLPQMDELRGEIQEREMLLERQVEETKEAQLRPPPAAVYQSKHCNGNKLLGLLAPLLASLHALLCVQLLNMPIKKACQV